MYESARTPEEAIAVARGIIDDCDRRIVEFTVQRLMAAEMIAIAKLETGDPIFVRGRDTEVRASRMEWATEAGADPDQLDAVEATIGAMLGISVDYQHVVQDHARAQAASPQP